MLKKIFISLAVIAVVVVVVMLYLSNRSRTLSPPGSAELTSGDLSIALTYSRPSVRGRLIFGPKEQEALQPYGAYWRLGANESTEVTFNRDVVLNGESVKAGSYRMYAFPGAESFEIVLNSELGTWGYFKPDPTLDVLHTSVPVQKITTPVEQYTIRLEPNENGINMIFEWSDTRFIVPVR
jgi:hypothetical protein